MDYTIIEDILKGRLLVQVKTQKLKMRKPGRLSIIGSDAIFIVQYFDVDYYIPLDSIEEIILSNSEYSKIKLSDHLLPLQVIHYFSNFQKKIMDDYKSLKHIVVKNDDGNIDHIIVDED